jgi:hypothetical protein
MANFFPPRLDLPASSLQLSLGSPGDPGGDSLRGAHGHEVKMQFDPNAFVLILGGRQRRTVQSQCPVVAATATMRSALRRGR